MDLPTILSVISTVAIVAGLVFAGLQVRSAQRAVDRTVPEEDVGRLRLQEKAFGLVGAFESGHTDTAERHDDVLAETTGW